VTAVVSIDNDEKEVEDDEVLKIGGPTNGIKGASLLMTRPAHRVR
jgi:hypothetical protein